MADTMKRTKTIVNSPHALDWAVIGWLGEPNTTVFWSTHRLATGRQAFHRIRDLLLGHQPAIHLPVDKLIQRNGEEEIWLVNGSRVIFRARTFNSGRGANADKLILDEAYMLTGEQYWGLTPVAAAQGSEIVYSQTEDPRADELVYHNNTGCPGHDEDLFKGGVVCQKR